MFAKSQQAIAFEKKSYFESFSDSFSPEYIYNSYNILFMFSRTMAIKHTFVYQNQVLAYRKNMASSVISKSKGKLF